MATVGNTINIGDTVEVKFTTLVGEVKGAAILEGTTMSYLVEFDDNDGVLQERYFTEDQIQPLV